LGTSITGGDTNITGNVAVDDTNGSINGNTVIEENAQLTADAGRITGTVENNAEDGLVLTGGDLASDVTGSGTTSVAGDVTNTAGKDIGNDVTIASTGSLTTSADNIGGAVENNADDGLTLTGGQLTQNVTGEGNTVIDGAGVSIAYGSAIDRKLRLLQAVI